MVVRPATACRLNFEQIVRACRQSDSEHVGFHRWIAYAQLGLDESTNLFGHFDLVASGNGISL